MNKKISFSIVFGLMFLVLIGLVLKVDVASIGPVGTSIGLSHINQAVNERLGSSDLWYKISSICGVLALGVGCCFGLVGLVQLVKRRSLLKVDPCILATGVLYVAVAALYVLFEKVVINYRPVIMPGVNGPEASFPSSHTMLVCVIMGSAAIIIGRYISGTPGNILRVCFLAILMLTVIGRMLSGVHWFTDILGGVLLSITLLLAYAGVLQILDDEVYIARH